MYAEYGAVLLGLIVLVWSADKFVIGAAATARHLGMSPLLVGLTIVSIGTSAPEMFVSAMAAIDGAGNLAIGNALGSNITNILLVLGVTALIAPIALQRSLLKKELPLLLLVSIIGGLTLMDLELNLIDAAILIVALIIALYLMFLDSSESGEAVVDEDEAAEIENTNMKSAIFWLVIGLAALMVSSKLLVWGATGIAHAFGVSDLVIGLTIVAIGTSLPELAASVASALKGHHDIAIGNVIGSNIFNLLAVMPIPGLLAVTAVEPMAFERDYMVMMGATIMLIALFAINYRKGTMGRVSGLLMIFAYIAYLVSLFYTA
ncbi:MAG: calcium/sodium antiporter [Thalassolituus oleivorans]|jgi:cation:H+ antiporter|uniref:calcium/sodium antiporter n=1 Tax=Thalassolituus oleivorans TaxID=187493 RepID=UPI001B5C1B68|nr:calcium/sodium antiporter [Thalassolituus oleivorans]MBQ0728661.1 calcium/sodium antiporter [Thalassolituus oleivorans]MBQ0781526.1 calcium/sodium antiporter [Thalassolituus oleivorans]MDF1640982.1 calcium/sodium antiporter [Thalassolituus oleivorans]|tara:strand:+ start:1663 stop:2619 length:957 start_codon:yes stop_codon:yes gene_type:complete